MSLEEGLRRWSAREGLEPGPAGRWALRLAEPGGPVGRGRALLVGDALGADPLAGEGIRYALWSGRIAGRLAARALSRGLVPSPQAYRRRLAASRSGMLLALSMRLAPRLHGGDPRWRRAAADRRVALAVAALVSGEAPLRPLLELAARFLAVGGRRPASTEYPLV